MQQLQSRRCLGTRRQSRQSVLVNSAIEGVDKGDSAKLEVLEIKNAATSEDMPTPVDRLIPPKSPASSKYRRAVAGLELQSTLSKSVSSSKGTDPYSRLFDRSCVSESPFLMAAATNRDKCDFFVAPKTRTSARHRVISPTPARILEAPGLEDDFYLNLLDWEPRSNLVTVLLGGGEIYFWKAHSVTSTCSASSGLSSTSNLTTLNRLSQAAGIADRGCVVKWSSSGSSKSTHGSSSLLGGSSANASDSSPLLAVGTRHGCVEVWDPWVQRRVHQWRAHPGARCGVLAWQGTGNGNLLTSGGRDQRLVHYDLRTPQGIVCAVQEHTQEVCGLKWDQHGSGLLASGGNDNQLLVWDPRQLSKSLLQLNQHTAAVKALDWCPHQAGLLASGGGTADRTIRFWNTKTVPGSSAGQTSPVEGFGSEPLSGDAAAFSSSFRHIQASSQVCTLAWSPLTPGEILSTHGFSEHNLCLWSYPSGQLIGTLEGHSHRVLFQALGPDGATVVTGSGDETLRFWNAFKKESGQRSALSRRLNTAADLYLHCR